MVAGAVLIDRGFLESDWCRRYAGVINDSKQLLPQERARLYDRMDWLRREHRILFAPGIASVAEIESENILGATRLAMRRAVEAVLALGRIQPHPPDPLFAHAEPVIMQRGQCISDWLMLLDGKPMRGLGFNHRAIVEGDADAVGGNEGAPGPRRPHMGNVEHHGGSMCPSDLQHLLSLTGTGCRGPGDYQQRHDPKVVTGYDRKAAPGHMPSPRHGP